MRYLHLVLAGNDVPLHPLVPTLTDADVFRDAKMVEWTPSTEPPRVTVLLYLEGDLERFDAVLAETDLVLEYDITAVDDGRGYAFVRSEPHQTEWRLFEIAASEGLLPVFPIQYHDDGSIALRVVGPTDRLQSAMEAMPDGIDASIQALGEYDLGRPPIPPSLPSRQREALEVACDLGHYDVPRRATRADVAERLGCSPSTASEHLRKAERAVVHTYLDRSG